MKGKAFKFKYVTHSISTYQLKYVLERESIVPHRRYRYLKFSLFGLSVNGAYTYMNSMCFVHFVFPWSVVRRYRVKPVIYHPYQEIKVMLPSRDRRIYYYPDKFSFEMELISEIPIPLSEVEEIYVNAEIDSETTRKLREYAPIFHGVPVDSEIIEVIQLLMQNKKIVKEYNRALAKEFNVDYTEPTLDELIQLLRLWKQQNT